MYSHLLSPSSAKGKLNVKKKKKNKKASCVGLFPNYSFDQQRHML